MEAKAKDLSKIRSSVFAKFSSFVQERYGNALYVNVIHNPDLKLLHIWRKPDSNCLRALEKLRDDHREVFVHLVPDFHVFVWCVECLSPDKKQDNVELKLVFTNVKGNVLFKDCYSVLSEDLGSLFDKLFATDLFLVNRLTDKSLTFCQGTSFEDKVIEKYLKDRSYENILIEERGNVVTVRSNNCTSAVFGNGFICTSCFELQEDVVRYASDGSQIKSSSRIMSDNKVVIKEQNFLDSEGDDCFYPDFSLDAADDEVFNVENDVDDSYTLSLPLKVEAETDPPSALIEIGKLKQCPKCFKTYTFATSCKRHIAKCDGVYRGRRSQPTTKSKSEEILRNDELLEKVCPLCLMEHKRYATLLSHLNQHKARIDVAAIVNCPLCQTAVSKLELNRHFSSAHPNEGSGICCECFKIGSEKVSLKRHFARNHKYESKNVLCPECGCGFTFHHELSVHYAEKHDKGGVNTAVCHQCGKTFHHRKRLVSHLRAAHRKSVKFECHVCVKVFYQQCHLVKHLRVHTGVKPWKCAHCVYKSVRKDNVLLHCRKVHQLLDANGERDVVKANDSEPTTVT